MESRRAKIIRLESQIENLEIELGESKEDNQSLTSNLERKRADLSKYGSEISELRKSLDKKDLEYNQKEREYSFLQNKYNQLEKESNQVKEKASELEGKVTKLEDAKSGLENDVKYLRSPANVEDVKAFLGEQSDKDYAEMKKELMEILAEGKSRDEQESILDKYGLDLMHVSSPSTAGISNWDFDINKTEDYTDEKRQGYFSRRFKDNEGRIKVEISFNTKSHKNYEDNFYLNRLASESSDLMRAALYGKFKKIILSDEKKYSETAKMLEKHPFLVDAGIKDIEMVCNEDVNARGYFMKYFDKK